MLALTEGEGEGENWHSGASNTEDSKQCFRLSMPCVQVTLTETVLRDGKKKPDIPGRVGERSE